MNYIFAILRVQLEQVPCDSPFHIIELNQRIKIFSLLKVHQCRYGAILSRDAEFCQTSKMECFAKMVNSFSAKSSTLNVWQDSEYNSVNLARAKHALAPLFRRAKFVKLNSFYLPCLPKFSSTKQKQIIYRPLKQHLVADTAMCCRNRW